MKPANHLRLRGFIREMDAVATFAKDDQLKLLECVEPLLARLIRHDDWLPPSFAQADSQHYQQYLLHCDPLERFSIVSFVWGPGQSTPIHDHRCWGLIGVMRGREHCTEYHYNHFSGLSVTKEHTLEQGQIDRVSVQDGDIHRVSNAHQDQVSLSIHVYGCNIGEQSRFIYSPDGSRRRFISGYSNSTLPNIWNRAAQ